MEFVHTVTDAKGNTKETWFDPLGRKTKDINVGNAGNSTAMHTTYTYNSNAQPSIATRNDGTKIKYSYDSMGRISRTDYYEASAPTTADSPTYILYQYNDNGKISREEVHMLLTKPNNTTETVTEVTVYSYDTMNRLVQMIQGDENSGLTVNYAYDNADRVTAVSYTKDNELRTIGYTYDGYGRLAGITNKLGSGTAKTVREYSYTANGDLHSTKDYRDFDGTAADAYVKTAYELNGAGMTTKITYTDYAGAVGVKKEEYTIGYDKRGYITSETAASNYDGEKTENRSYVYDDLGRLTSSTMGEKTHTYTYDKVGNRR